MHIHSNTPNSVCHYCGEPFYAKPCQIAKGRKFCSRSCSSRAVCGRYTRTAETKAKNRAGRVGAGCSEETRARLSQLRRAQVFTPETWARIAEANRRKAKTPEFQAKMCEARKAYWEGRPVSASTMRRRRGWTKRYSPAWRDAVRRGVLGALAARPEIRDRLREARLKQSFPKALTSIEIMLRDEFTRRGFAFECQRRLFDRFVPDFVFEQHRLVVQADGVYWHGPNAPEGNKIRDAAFDTLAQAEGWTVMRFSETKICESVSDCADEVAALIATK